MFEWKLDDIRIRKIIWAPVWAPIFFLLVSALLDVKNNYHMIIVIGRLCLSRIFINQKIVIIVKYCSEVTATGLEPRTT